MALGGGGRCVGLWRLGEAGGERETGGVGFSGRTAGGKAANQKKTRRKFCLLFVVESSPLPAVRLVTIHPRP